MTIYFFLHLNLKIFSVSPIVYGKFAPVGFSLFGIWDTNWVWSGCKFLKILGLHDKLLKK